MPDLEHARADSTTEMMHLGDCREKLLENVGVNDIPVMLCRVSLGDFDVGIL